MYGHEIRNKLPSLSTTAIPEDVRAKDEATKKKTKNMYTGGETPTDTI